MSKVIVTGGAGFIGSNLVQELLKRGHQVSILDNLSTGRLSNIEFLLDDKNVAFVRGSVNNLALMRRLFSGTDFVFHQAAVPSVPRSIRDPRTSHLANATGTLNVLLAARDNSVKKVVFASSSSVYGDTPTLPKVEDMAPNPQSPYAVSKLAAEQYCRVFEQVYGLNTVCLRYFNVYGPRQDPGSPYAAVIPLFINSVLAGKSPVIFGDGEQTRDFTYVKDVVTANILAAESPATGIFNVGSGFRVTINRLAQLIIKIVGDSKIKVVHREARPGDVLHSLADISRAKTFGYRPRYTLEDGLPEVVEYLRQLVK